MQVSLESDCLLKTVMTTLGAQIYLRSFKLVQILILQLSPTKAWQTALSKCMD